MIYIVHAPDVFLVKIGYTTQSAKTRLSCLQTGSPVPLVLVGEFAGDLSVEKALHEQFASFRKHGEWFSDEILPALHAEFDIEVANDAKARRLAEVERQYYDLLTRQVQAGCK